MGNTNDQLGRLASDRANSNPEPGSFAVYVAAGSSETDAARVRVAIAWLKSHGFVVTATWPETIAKVGDANPRRASSADRRGWSTQDLNEIDAADAVWFLVPSLPSTTRGAWFEAGYAFSEKKHLLFSGDTKQSVFCALGVEFDGDHAAIFHLRDLRGDFKIGPDAFFDDSDSDTPRSR